MVAPTIGQIYYWLMPFDDRPTRLTALTIYLISQTARVAKSEMDARLAARGMRLRHQAVLAVLDEGSASQLDIARRLRLDPSDVTATVDDLETAGFAGRHPDTVDRRRKIVKLTAKGQREVEALEIIAREVEDRLLEPLPVRRRAEMHRDLFRVLVAHDEEGESVAAAL